MAKTILKLKEEDHFDFLLFSIICQQKDYRLCRELNLKLDIRLQREEDYKVFNGKRMEDQEFAFSGSLHRKRTNIISFPTDAQKAC